MQQFIEKGLVDCISSSHLPQNRVHMNWFKRSNCLLLFVICDCVDVLMYLSIYIYIYRPMYIHVLRQVWPIMLGETITWFRVCAFTKLALAKKLSHKYCTCMPSVQWKLYKVICTSISEPNTIRGQHAEKVTVVTAWRGLVKKWRWLVF